MCGICGILDFTGGIDLIRSVQRMADPLFHRGPDDGDVRVYSTGISARECLALGHRRLSVIDLSAAARQPMEGSGGRTAVVLNGEIYNFLEKRSEYPSYPYKSHSDTEVILAVYERHGESFVEQLEGMFAIALWDRQEGKLYLGRDRAGKKPLFYIQTPEFFAFASEIKSLLAFDRIAADLDERALPLYLTFGYVPTPRTFYRKIRKLEPGTLMTVALDGTTRSRNYWRYPLPSRGSSKARAATDRFVRELRELLDRAVSSRLAADVPLGAFLSGGLDSSIIVGTMSRLVKEPVRTFSIGFEGDRSFDETAYARTVSKAFGTKHTEFRVRPNAIDLIERLVWLHDEPFGDSSAIPTYIVSKLARNHVTVALSGDGGDELFAGYERFAAAIWTERLPASLFGLGRALSRLLPAPGHMKSTRRRVKRFLEKSTLPLRDRFLEWNSFFDRGQVASLILNPTDQVVEGSFEECFRTAAHCSLLKQLLYLNFRTYLLDDLLVKTDRMSMANGLEVRCPFLDTRLVEWAAELEDDLKIRGKTLKYILRLAYHGSLPEEVLTRAKMGFGVPLGHWVRTGLRNYCGDLLLGSSSRIREFLDPDVVRDLILEHMSGRQDHGQKIWALLTLEVWLRRIAAGDRSEPSERRIAEISEVRTATS